MDLIDIIVAKKISGGGGSGIKNIWDSTGEGAVAGGSTLSNATGAQAFAFGGLVTASGDYSHAEGGSNSAL